MHQILRKREKKLVKNIITTNVLINKSSKEKTWSKGVVRYVFDNFDLADQLSISCGSYFKRYLSTEISY